MIGGRHHIQRNNPLRNGSNVVLQHAANGMWTASIVREGAQPFYLHSRYDPTTEADRFASAQLKSIEGENPARIVLYGIGCGHHVKALLKRTESSEVSIEVWETNVSAFLHMEEQGVFGPLMDELRFHLVVSDDLQVFSERVRAWEGNRVHVIVHEPSLRAAPEELSPLMRVLQEYQIKKNSAIIHRELMKHNFIQNNQRNWPSISALRGLPGAPAILISAGPSLAKTLAALPAAAKHCLIGTVGTAAPLLYRHGIRPDFVVMTDPQPKMLDQIEGWNTEEVPLFFLSTLYSKAVERYQGPRFILYQEGYDPAESTASERGEPLVSTGGSVSTTLFSLTRSLGMGPICLVGQDLAYTNSLTHVEGTPLSQKWEGPVAGEWVRAFDGQGSVVSPRNLLLYKKWFEEQARNSCETFYNATEGGAYIEGFEHITFAQFLMKVMGCDVSNAREYFQQRVRGSTSI